MGCDCVPHIVYCDGEVVYGAGPIEGAGMANSVAILQVERLSNRRYYSRESSSRRW
jgi:hypothetical protein